MKYVVDWYETRRSRMGDIYYLLYARPEGDPIAEHRKVVTFEKDRAYDAIVNGFHAVDVEVQLDGIYQHVKFPNARRTSIVAFTPVTPNGVYLEDPRAIAARTVNAFFKKVED